MNRIQQIIAVITLAEKAERKTDSEVRKATLGYDPGVWLESDVQIRDNDQMRQTYCKVELPPPAKGKHKYSHCSQLYIDIHNFQAKREWAPTQYENNIGGATWIELFILFITTAARSAKRDHVKDPEAAARAEKEKTERTKHK